MRIPSKRRANGWRAASVRLSAGVGLACALWLVGLLLASPRTASAGSQIDINGPPGSAEFGAILAVLPNGNVVVIDQEYSDGATLSVGAARLYNGATGALIATLTGSTADDRVGSGGVTALSNGAYLVKSPNWNNGTADDAGAVTHCDGTTGCTGVVTSANSLVGETAFDRVGVGGVTVLSNGAYVVSSPYWNNGAEQEAGAATRCDGGTGCTGSISTANSLVGGSEFDGVSDGGVTALNNGAYVVSSPSWDNGVANNAGAVTRCDGALGCTGAVSAANSLAGASEFDEVSSGGVTTLSNGAYVVSSPMWDNGEDTPDAGAATRCDGAAGCTGAVSAANSLVGETDGDKVGSDGVTALTNGPYVVSSSRWSNGAMGSVGAVTRCDGATGCTGAVSAANSLVGGTALDVVGEGGAIALTNGAYVVRSTDWDNGAMSGVGAVTRCDGTTGCTGLISPANSLVGATAFDGIGSGVTALSDGAYVVTSPGWTNGAADDAGAVTRSDGATGCTGVVSAANSLVGSASNDRVGSGGAIALNNGAYVVSSPQWSNGAVESVGAATRCDGATGCTGLIFPANSLVGGTAFDAVSEAGVHMLNDGAYVVNSPNWDDAGADGAGAVTVCRVATGCTGVVSAANSLVGSAPNDGVGSGGVTELSDDAFVVLSPLWDKGAVANSGAVTLAAGCPAIGAITAVNSVLGGADGGGGALTFAHDSANAQLIVGRSSENMVSLRRAGCSATFLPIILR